MSDGFSYHAGSGLSPDFDLYSPDFNLYEKSGFSGPDPVRTPSLSRILLNFLAVFSVIPSPFSQITSIIYQKS